MGQGPRVRKIFVISEESLGLRKPMAVLIGAGAIWMLVAANAGGVFSPFGDITTLLVWQRGLVDFTHDTLVGLLSASIDNNPVVFA